MEWNFVDRMGIDGLVMLLMLYLVKSYVVIIGFLIFGVRFFFYWLIDLNSFIKIIGIELYEK